MSTSLLLATFSAFLAGTVHAQSSNEARKYAVLSLIGDALTVITYQPSTGSSLDTNRSESISMPDRVARFVGGHLSVAHSAAAREHIVDAEFVARSSSTGALSFHPCSMTNFGVTC